MGRPKGSKNKKTLEKERLAAENAKLLTNTVADAVLHRPEIDTTDAVMTSPEMEQ